MPYTRAQLYQRFDGFTPKLELPALRVLPPPAELEELIGNLEHFSPSWIDYWIRETSKIDLRLFHEINPDNRHFKREFEHGLFSLFRKKYWLPIRGQIYAESNCLEEEWSQVKYQVWVICFLEIKEHLGLVYEHPAFDQVRKGIFMIGQRDGISYFNLSGQRLDHHFG